MAIALTTQSVVCFPNGFGLHLIHIAPSFAYIVAKEEPADEEASRQFWGNFSAFF
jgi:hypothetical protein